MWWPGASASLGVPSADGSARTDDRVAPACALAPRRVARRNSARRSGAAWRA